MCKLWKLQIFRFHSINGATAPSGPWLLLEDASILLGLLLVTSILLFL